MRDKIPGTIIPEINEVRLINELAEYTLDWTKTLRFTRENPSERSITDDEKSTSPKVYKYYFPENQVKIPANVETVGVGNAESVERLRNLRDDGLEKILDPAILIRFNESTTGIEDGLDFEDVTVEFEIRVSEHDTVMRFQNLALAKNAIIHGLRTLRARKVANYRLDWNINSHPSDNDNKPKAAMFISTTWRRFLPQIAQRSLDEIL